MPRPKPCKIRTVINIARYGDPAAHPAPIKDSNADAASAFRRPIQSASQPWQIAPNAAPAAKRALTAPRILNALSARFPSGFCFQSRWVNTLCGVLALSCSVS